jgi:hypothetical protein
VYWRAAKGPTCLVRLTSGAGQSVFILFFMKTFGANVSMARTHSGIGDKPPLPRLSLGSCYPLLETFINHFLPDNVLSLPNAQVVCFENGLVPRLNRPQPTVIQFKTSDHKASFNLRMDTKRGLIQNVTFAACGCRRKCGPRRSTSTVGS